MIVRPVAPRAVLPLIDALTAELAGSGYDESEMFGYSVAQLEAQQVYLVGAFVDEVVVGIGGIEIGPDRTAELKRFYVEPGHRGTGAASAVLDHLVAYAAGRDVAQVRLETGTEQHAAIRFYTRHGFVRIEPFGPYVGSASSICMARPIQSSDGGARTASASSDGIT